MFDTWNPAVLNNQLNGLSNTVSGLKNEIEEIEAKLPADYSTTETATGQKWIDGKEIYKLTIEKELPEITSNVNINISETLPHDLNVINIEIADYSSTGSSYRPTSAVYYTKSGYLVQNGVTSTMSEGSIVATIYYTKPDPTP